MKKFIWIWGWPGLCFVGAVAFHSIWLSSFCFILLLLSLFWVMLGCRHCFIMTIFWGGLLDVYSSHFWGIYLSGLVIFYLIVRAIRDKFVWQHVFNQMLYALIGLGCLYLWVYGLSEMIEINVNLPSANQTMGFLLASSLFSPLLFKIYRFLWLQNAA